MGTSAVTPELSTGFLASMHVIFLVFFVLTILGAIISLGKSVSLSSFLRARV